MFVGRYRMVNIFLRSLYVARTGVASPRLQLSENITKRCQAEQMACHTETDVDTYFVVPPVCAVVQKQQLVPIPIYLCAGRPRVPLRRNPPGVVRVHPLLAPARQSQLENLLGHAVLVGLHRRQMDVPRGLPRRGRAVPGGGDGGRVYA